ncbi:hypothetical protein ACFQO7_28015 [Catellatospora aurea]|uniref:Uncharacterized protein n=1 Tax=Catellatospora aurea TaxID=1337874 RepID=A0ABW2H391_9ACTN
MTELSPPRPSWFRETLTLLRSCWRPVLAISVVTEAAMLIAGGALLLWFYGGPGRQFGLDEPLLVAVGYGLPAVLTAACSAWMWAAAVEVFRGVAEGRRVRIGAALRLGLWQSGRLTLWLAGVGLLRAAGSIYLLYVVLDSAQALGMYRTASTAVTAGGWYLSFSVALLPLVVLLGRRGPGRAWRLAHSRAATIGQIIAVLLFGLAVDEVADRVLSVVLQVEMRFTLPLAVEVAVDSITGVLVSTVTMAALTVAYLRRVASPAPPAGDPAPGGAEPVVIELGRA